MGWKVFNFARSHPDTAPIVAPTGTMTSVRESERRRSRRIRLMWIFVLGVLLLLAAWVLKAAGASNEDLQRAANQSQVLGLLLTAGTAFVGLAWWMQQKLTEDRGVSDWAAELAHRVAVQEDRNRRDLLGTVHAADVPMGEVSIESLDELCQWFVTEESDECLRLDTLGSYYRNLGSNARLVILGEPGSGKTVSAVQLIVHLLRLDPEPQVVPVRFSLAGWDPAHNVDDWFADRLARDYQVPLPHAEDLVRKRRILPVLDGLDEMDPGPEGGPPSRAIAVLSWLNDKYTVGGELAGAIVTCRSQRYAKLVASGVRLEHSREIQVLPLEQDQIRAYIDRVFHSDAAIRTAWQPALDALDQPGSGAIWAVLATPWRLTLAITLVRAGRSPQEVLSAHEDESPADAALRIQDQLLDRYIESATRLSEDEDRISEKRVRDTTKWLTELARHLQRTSVVTGHEFSAIDIVPHRIFDSAPTARRLHGAIAGTVMAIGCLMLALDGIGSVGEWYALVRFFFTEEYDLASRFSQDILPVTCLLGLPVLAARLALTSAPNPVPRRLAGTEFGRRFRRNIGPAFAGATVTFFTTMFLFDAKDWMSWTTSFLPWAESGEVVGPVAVLCLLLALVLLVRKRFGRGAAWIASTVVGVFSVWPIYQDVFSDIGDSPSATWTLGVTFLVVVSGWWGVAMALVAQQSNSLQKAAVARLQLVGRQRHWAFAASVVLPGFTVWLINTLGSGFADESVYMLMGPLDFEFNPAYAVAVGIGSGLFAALNTAFRSALGGGVVVGCITGLVLGFFGGFYLDADLPGVGMYLYTAYAMQLAIGALIGAALISLLLREPVPSGAERRRPQAALRDDLMAATVSAVVIAVPVLLVFEAGIGRAVGIPKVDSWGAISIAVTAALAFGPLGRHAWIRYRLGAALAAAHGRLPLKLNRFFNWATEAGLLRVSGSAYQFRHLELQQWLLRNGMEESAKELVEPARASGE